MRPTGYAAELVISFWGTFVGLNPWSHHGCLTSARASVTRVSPETERERCPFFTKVAAMVRSCKNLLVQYARKQVADTSIPSNKSNPTEQTFCSRIIHSYSPYVDFSVRISLCISQFLCRFQVMLTRGSRNLQRPARLLC